MMNYLIRKLSRWARLAMLGLFTVSSVAFADPAPTNNQSIVGSGASFPAPVYAKWATNFAQQNNLLVNYQSIGSGGGVKQIKAKLVDFGASDYPLSAQELDESGLFQFPTLGGGIVMAINLRELNDKLVLNGDIIAKIYMGQITKWNDPAIQALNPDLELPDLFIAVLFRSDGSGTTYNFSKYLSDVSPEFKARFGVGKAINFPVGLGGKGNEGVAAVLPRVYGAIGYMEYGYAKTMHMGVAAMQNKYGNIVRASDESFAHAIAAADWQTSLAPNVSNLDDAQAWPINAITYVLIHKDSSKLEILKNYFSFGMLGQQAETKDLMYVPFNSQVAEFILNHPSTFSSSVKTTSSAKSLETPAP
ncbi:phosphate ABC transporter substrate-binding protein PstS [Psittacicella hinzii]|nr:phosphate ABC transporter substrate-binding protein PstS [Psittacicella hinzii]